MADGIISTVRRFSKIQERFKQFKKQYDGEKEEFESEMLTYFDKNGGGRKFECETLSGDNVICVTKTERTSIEWDEDKLKIKVPKELHKYIFKKRYEIVDYRGLVRYLKSLGADPEIFKTFVTSETVFDESAIDMLDNKGLLTLNNIKGCYRVKCQKPYFTVTVKKGKGNGE